MKRLKVKSQDLYYWQYIIIYFLFTYDFTIKIDLSLSRILHSDIGQLLSQFSIGQIIFEHFLKCFSKIIQSVWLSFPNSNSCNNSLILNTNSEGILTKNITSFNSPDSLQQTRTRRCVLLHHCTTV